MLGFYELVVAQTQADRMETMGRLPSRTARRAVKQAAIDRYSKQQSQRARERDERRAARGAALTALVNTIKAVFQKEQETNKPYVMNTVRRHASQMVVILAVVLTLTLAGYQSAIAQEATEVAVKIDMTDCSANSREVAYQTLVNFVPWMLARTGRMAALSDAERQAFFRTFATHELWKTGIPAGDDIEG
jgi:hypothetical protein